MQKEPRDIGYATLAGVLSHPECDLIARRVEMSTRAPETCTVGRGGIIAMRPLLLHSSTKALSDEPRRVIHIEYAESLDFGMGLRLGIA